MDLEPRLVGGIALYTMYGEQLEEETVNIAVDRVFHEPQTICAHPILPYILRATPCLTTYETSYHLLIYNNLQ
jgi:hypothetical protein